ncbi:ribonuclease H-like domain-containing protein [Mycena metata]|uniref:Ribonuclease H-like domain-containing protein n=1 Tax=Mycena metata TaxID=1033252 RepID=A0AAD7IPU5_9AGAR|nr:ribonuclease H-like domain-containing protein [Mycena metata]
MPKPLSLVARCRPAPSSPPRSPPRRTMSTASAPRESRILAALADMSLTELGDARSTVVESTKPPGIHPFFRAATTPAVKPPASAPQIKATTSLPVPGKKSSLVRISPPKVIEKTAAVTEEPRATEVEVEAPVDLPIYSYKTLSPAPTMRFTRDELEADKWVAELDNKGPISVDLEWVVVFRKGGIRPVSLVQVADAKNIIVIQLRTQLTTMPRFPRELQRILEDRSIPKMGANILNDAKKLFKDYGVMMTGLIELGALARQADPPSTDAKLWGNGKKIVALAKLVEQYLGKKLLKDDNVRVSNWENPKLEEQETKLDYAANDAYSGLQVYNRLMYFAEEDSIPLNPFKYTGEVYYSILEAPYRRPPPALTKEEMAALPPVPMVLLTPAMEASGMQPQFLRAYRHWRLGARHIDTMCIELALKPGTTLQRSTIISYVVNALKAWPMLPCDFAELRLLIQTDIRSWERHSEWFMGATSAITHK